MIAALSSGVSWLLPNTGMFCGPVSMAPYMSRLVECCSAGANLPDDSAPPPVENPWHEEQLTRYSSPPCERVLGSDWAFLTSPSRLAALGSCGPPPNSWV